LNSLAKDLQDAANAVDEIGLPCGTNITVADAMIAIAVSRNITEYMP
jgi:hypothetical protein